MVSFRGLKGRVKKAVFRAIPARLYLRLYARDTDRRVAHDPVRASGHPEKYVAPLVMRYVRHLGLRPHHTLLDFGCGTLRTGKHLIDFLEPDRYAGVDISRGAVEYARTLIETDERLAGKRPTVQVVRPFQELDLPWSPDFILCHSVFTHLPRRAALRTFRQLRRAMSPGTRLAVTAFCGGTYRYRNYKNIQHPVDEFVDLSRRAGIDLEVVEGDWGLSHTLFSGRAGGRGADEDAGLPAHPEGPRRDRRPRGARW